MNTEQVWNEEQRDKTGTEQIDEENIEHRRLAEHHEKEYVESDV